MNEKSYTLLDNRVSQWFSAVFYSPEPGPGGAFSSYQICAADNDNGPAFASIEFQSGAILEAGGVNGCFNEDLLAIVAHRLECFQKSEFACRENALALTKIEEALHWLNARTTARQKRGVEGTHKV